MNNLINIQNGQAVTTSRQVAENFGKRHDNVIRDVEDIMGSLKIEDTHMFYKTTYKHPQNNQQYPEYIMNRDGFTLLAMGFTGSDAMQWKIKYIQAFNEMEKQLTSPQQLTRMQILELAMESEKKVIELQATITEQKPKILFADSVAGSNDLISVNQLSKILNQNGIEIGEKRLFIWLRENGYLHKGGDDYNLPTQRSMDLNAMEIRKSSVITSKGDTLVTRTTKVTGKGQLYFINKFLNNKLEAI